MSYRAVTTEILFMLESEGESLTGFLSTIWETLSPRLNFSLVSVGTFDFGHAFSETNGTGVLGTLLRNVIVETDFSVIPMFLKHDSIKWLDYTSVVVYQPWSLVSGPPRRFHHDYVSILSCFDKSLWLATLIALFVYCLLWAILSKTLKKDVTNWVSFAKEFANFLFASAMVLVNQSSGYKGGRLYQRLYWISWTIASMCLSWSFTCIMLAKLAKKADPMRYEQLRDIVEDKNMKLCLMLDSPPYDEMKTSLDPQINQLFKRLQSDGTIQAFEDLNFGELGSQMKEGEMVLMMDEEVFLYTATLVCDYLKGCYVASKPYILVKYSLYMRKELDRDTKDLIKSVAIKIQENQLMQSKIDTVKWLGKMCMSSSPDEPLDVPLTTEKFYFLTIFYIIFASFAFCALLFEMSSHAASSIRKKDKKRTKKVTTRKDIFLMKR